MTNLYPIERDIKLLRERLVEKVPGHFGMRHVITSFFGALFFGFSFMLNGLLFEVGLRLQATNLILITLSTWLILSAEIFFVGYTRVPDTHKRPFGQFWAKRILTYYLISILTAVLLLTAYGIPLLAGSVLNTFKLVIAVSFPAAVGAATADLLGKY